VKARVFFVLAAGAIVSVAIFGAHRGRLAPAAQEPQPRQITELSQPAESAGEFNYLEPAPATKTNTRAKLPAIPVRALPGGAITNRLEQLAQIRQEFHLLAAGDAASALREAKKISDETGRETALLTLVTEWTQGELGPPRERAGAIELYGLEAGLGMELVKNPELAVLWANEMTDGPGRAALLQQTAVAMTASDPSAAFELSEQLPQSERRSFFGAVFAGWAAKDTDAALQWAQQLPDPSERDAAIQSIRSVAPVGIGTELSMQDGYAVIHQLLPGTPAELSGQLHSGDRIVGLAQGDNAFMDAHGLALKDIVDMIRGTPGTVLQLQVISADAPAGTPPQVVSITRDQLKFKR
jgi:PDZ domain